MSAVATTGVAQSLLRADARRQGRPVNTLFGRDLVFLGARILVVMTVLATFAWRRPQHYLLVCGCVLAAEAILLVGRWRLLGKALRRLQDAETREERG